jgi:transcriptional regulator with XRE-family HTH domain
MGKETLGERLARLRKERGFTQTELADKIGILQNLVSAYERGRLRLSADMVIRFSKALGVRGDEILGLEKGKSNGGIRNRRILRRIQQIDNLPRRDQEALLRTIDAFLAKAS